MVSSQKSKVDSKPRLVKYMGSSHVRILEKGDTIGGELVKGIPSTVEWHIDKHHIAEIPDDWSESALSALLDYDEGDGVKEFVDVTDKERVPSSLGQQLWRGAKKTVGVDEVLPDAAGSPLVNPSGGGTQTGAGGDTGNAGDSSSTL